MPEKYTLVLSSSAMRSLETKLDTKMAWAVYELIRGPLKENPQRLGKRLVEPFEGHWSARKGGYRVIYTIDERRMLITVVAIDHRADVYRPR